MNKMVLSFLLTLFLISYGYALNERLESQITEDLKSLLIEPFDPTPALKFDDVGQLHMFYPAEEIIRDTTMNVDMRYWQIRYRRYDRETANPIVKYKLNTPGGIEGHCKMDVTPDGTAYCVFGPAKCPRGILIFDQDGQDRLVTCTPGHPMHEYGGIYEGDYFWISNDNDGLFGHVEQDGSVMMFGDSHNFWQQVDMAIDFNRSPFHHMILRTVDLKNIMFIGHALEEIPGDRTEEKLYEMVHFGIYIYNIKEREAVSDLFISLLDNLHVTRTNLPYDRWPRVFNDPDGNLQIFTGYKDGNNQIKMCYFTINDKLQLLSQKERTVTGQYSLDFKNQADILDEIIIYEDLRDKSAPEPLILGKLHHYQISSDTIFHSQSKNIARDSTGI
ncbi:MAG: hypothetical protein GWO41_11285 [candidate division Zixibacteria bacterium]|nr:hypothetical protein [candidate division Zixibacteria bacterium]NIR67744.1 hypothetical protein [candidate division Zixibacteria bacterium]NIS16886.1 hypothetical protein [candidate division Zixibacteria bacterium]NIS48999.1 hypothetical protein [candidate division Zixibacteria bacterium]NIT53298.1 hypothetical protein [candidate division Zixibacteria bacterium]